MYLKHYGVKGMKWGVRRYQLPNGRLTPEGKKHAKVDRKAHRNMKTTAAANEVVESLTQKEKKFLGAPKYDKWIEPEFDLQYSRNIAKRFVQYEMKDAMEIPVSFLEIWDDGGTVGQIALATKSGEQYRGKGYASKSVKEGLEWFNKYGYKTLERLEWIAAKENTASNNLAKKYGFKKANWTDYDWAEQPKDNLYVYEKELKHHGILGQKWGIRRYQPYGQGYDPEHKGKFVGKRQQRKNTREIQRLGLKTRGKARGRFDLPVKIRQTKMAQEYLQSDTYKRAFSKYQKSEKDLHDMTRSMEYHEYVHETMSPKQFDEMMKKVIKVNAKHDKQYKALCKMGEDYAELVLGKYGKRGVQLGYMEKPDGTAKDKLAYALNPIHENGDSRTAAKRLSKQMSEGSSAIKYKNFTKLKSHDEVSKTKSGDCHSQVMYETEELRKYGIDPKAKFFIEYDPKTNQGGQTHSFVYFSDPVTKKTYWLENAWGSQKGLHEYKNEREMVRDVMKKHKSEQTDDRKQFTKVEWGEFNPDEHTPGESLQELVDKCLK